MIMMMMKKGSMLREFEIDLVVPLFLLPPPDHDHHDPDQDDVVCCLSSLPRWDQIETFNPGGSQQVVVVSEEIQSFIESILAKPEKDCDFLVRAAVIVGLHVLCSSNEHNTTMSNQLENGHHQAHVGDMENMSEEDNDEISEWMQQTVVRKAWKVLLLKSQQQQQQQQQQEHHDDNSNNKDACISSSLLEWCHFLQKHIIPRLIIVSVEHPVYTYATSQVSYLTQSEREQVAGALLLLQNNNNNNAMASNNSTYSNDSSSTLKLIKDLQDAHPPQLYAVLLDNKCHCRNSDNCSNNNNHHHHHLIRRNNGGGPPSIIIIPPHSCFPNAHWQLLQRRRRRRRRNHESSKQEQDEEATTSSTKMDFVVHLVATYDINNNNSMDDDDNDDDNSNGATTTSDQKEEEEEEEQDDSMITVSRIMNESCLSVEDRERQISLVLGHSCSCLKCQLEASSAFDMDISNEDGMMRILLLQQDNISARELLHLACSYMMSCSVESSSLSLNDDSKNENRSDPLNVAKRIYQLIVFKFPHYKLEAQHALGAIELSRGHFLAAQRIWEKAQLEYHNTRQPPPHERQLKQQELPHAGLVDQWDKLKAFGYLQPPTPPPDKTVQDERNPSTISNSRSIFPGNVFRTINMVSVDQCKTILEWVGAAGDTSTNSGGTAGLLWTQQRHYAVPTQDIPIHKCSEYPLLSWFNTWMHQQVCPLLARLFETSCNYYVHDAFIVRYEATSPYSYLPIHVDESSHSLVLALNENDNYQGGGTYFYNANETIQLQTGELLSFRGDQLLHGGQAVTSGVRYILAIFLFHDDDNGDDDDGNGINIPTKNRSSNFQNIVHHDGGEIKLLQDDANNSSSTKQIKKRSIEDNKGTMAQVFRASKEQKSDFSFGFLETTN